MNTIIGKGNGALNNHVDEVVNFTTTATRTLSSSEGAGTQTITIALPKAPKHIRVECSVDTKNFASWGEYCQNGQNCTVRYGAAGTTTYDGKMGIAVVSTYCIMLSDGGSDYYVAAVQSVSATEIVLNWTKHGNGIDGTAYLRITASTH